MSKEDLFAGMELGFDDIELGEVDVSNIPKIEDTPKPNNIASQKPEENLNIVPSSDTEQIEVPDNVEDTTTTSSLTKDTTTSKNNTANSNKPFAELSKIFYDEGLFTDFDEENFDKLVEDEGGNPVAAMATLMKNTLDKTHQEWIESYPEPIQNIIKAHNNGVPLDKMLEVKRNQLTLDKISENDLEGDNNLDKRKEVLEEHYKLTTNFSSIKIKKLIDQSINLGEDIEESKEALEEIKTFYKQEERRLKDETVKQEEQRKKIYEERMVELKNNIYSTKEIIPSIPLTKKEQDDLHKSMTSYNHVNSQGRPVTDVDYLFDKNPIEMRKALHYYTMKGLFKLDDKTGTWNPDFTKINNVLKTQITRDVKNNAAKSTTFKGGLADTTEENSVNLAKSLEGWLKNK